MRRLILILQILAALIAICTFFLGLMAALPDRYSIKNVLCTNDEKVEFTIKQMDAPGTTVIQNCQASPDVQWKQGLFSRKSLLDVSGEIQLQDFRNVHIWAFLVDRYGHFYIQYPPARIVDSQWRISNIWLGREITSIEFWLVDDAANKKLLELCDERIRTSHWPAIPKEKLPSHKVLGVVDLIFKRGFPYVF